MTVNSKYGFKVGDVVRTKIEVEYENGYLLGRYRYGTYPAGTLLQIVAIAPKVRLDNRWSADDPKRYDRRDYFYNAVLLGQQKDYTYRVRENFVTIEHIDRAEYKKSRLVDRLQSRLNKAIDFNVYTHVDREDDNWGQIRTYRRLQDKKRKLVCVLSDLFNFHAFGIRPYDAKRGPVTFSRLMASYQKSIADIEFEKLAKELGG